MTTLIPCRCGNGVTLMEWNTLNGPRKESTESRLNSPRGIGGQKNVKKKFEIVVTFTSRIGDGTSGGGTFAHGLLTNKREKRWAPAFLARAVIRLSV